MNVSRTPSLSPTDPALADLSAVSAAAGGAGGPAIPDIGSDVIPDTGTPTAALPVVGADGTAVPRSLPTRMRGQLTGGLRRWCCCCRAPGVPPLP